MYHLFKITLQTKGKGDKGGGGGWVADELYVLK